MRAFFGGLGVGLGLALVAALVALQVGAFELATVTVCRDARCCGADTRWEDGACVPDAPEAEGGTGGEKEDKPRRRRRRGRRGAAAGGEGEAGPVELVDDARVPRFDPRADQTIDLDAGSERLSDRQIDGAMSSLDAAFRRCVESASRAGELGSGTVKLEFGVAGTGKVTGVNATAPAAMTRLGLVPCVRVALHQHRFPSFDGPVMTVRSSFSVD